MPLDFVSRPIADAGGTTAIQRFFIDMPLVTKKVCMIRQVHVVQIELQRAETHYDTRFAMSVDPDHVLANMIILDSTIFLSGSWQQILSTNVGFAVATENEKIFHFPEGIECPYTRLPFFINHSNTAAVVTNWVVRVFYEFVSLTAQELATAVLRRGRGVTRD